MTVDFITFCYRGDIDKLYEPGKLDSIIDSHRYPFDNVKIIHQRCNDLTLNDKRFPVYHSENFPYILDVFGIADNEYADKISHGPTAPHYWKWHTINHLIGATVSYSDYIVFSDSDCRMVEPYTERNELDWIAEGITLLEARPDLMIVSPSDGASIHEDLITSPIGHIRLTRNFSQQLFLVNRQKFINFEFDIPWEGEYTAPYGPMQEYYVMLEGRMWRHAEKYKMWRAILPHQYRYWHGEREQE